MHKRLKPSLSSLLTSLLLLGPGLPPAAQAQIAPDSDKPAPVSLSSQDSQASQSKAQKPRGPQAKTRFFVLPNDPMEAQLLLAQLQEEMQRAKQNNPQLRQAYTHSTDTSVEGLGSFHRFKEKVLDLLSHEIGRKIVLTLTLAGGNGLRRLGCTG